MRIVSITAGAAGMFCGSCLRDNTLAAALGELGHETLLLPTYTPIRTDEPDVSRGPIFFGGISVYLRQKYAFARRLPSWLFRPLDSRWLLQQVSRHAVSVRAEDLGQLTVAMLEGSHGPQRSEIDRLVTWLGREWKPDVILLTNVLLSGVVPALKERLGVPIVATLQGDDIFLDALPASYRQRCVELIQQNCRAVDAYIATCRYYADFMSTQLGLPGERFHVVFPGIRVEKFHRPLAQTPHDQDKNVPIIGYLARIAPEKGLHRLADAFIQLRDRGRGPRARLHIAGWLGEHHRSYWNQVCEKLAAAGLSEDIQRFDVPDHESKVRFLHSLDLFSVPAPYREPKGLYLLEAWAAGLPVVQPAHGSFPELIAATQGGILFQPDDVTALAEALRSLIEDPERRRRLGQSGQQVVCERFTAERMARDTLAVFDRVLVTKPALKTG